jgi:hypothetical protein
MRARMAPEWLQVPLERPQEWRRAQWWLVEQMPGRLGAKFLRADEPHRVQLAEWE